MKNKCYTIGHSTQEINLFVETLKKYGIDCLIDVRSVPYSKFSPQFNKENLAFELKKNKILYSNFDREFGARRTEGNVLFHDGKVDFEKVISSLEFINGINRVKEGLNKDYNIAIMCTEKNPFDCHRFVMVSRGLELNGIEVEHILEDGTTIKNIELEKLLLKKYKIEYGKQRLFGSTVTFEEAIKEGYKKRNIDIGYENNEGGE